VVVSGVYLTPKTMKPQLLVLAPIFLCTILIACNTDQARQFADPLIETNQEPAPADEGLAEWDWATDDIDQAGNGRTDDNASAERFSIGTADIGYFAASTVTDVHGGIAIPQESYKDKPAPAKETPRPKNDQLVGRKIIWKADLRFQVNNVDSATTSIRDIVDLNGGFVADMNMENGSQQIANKIRIRVSNDQFHELIDQLKFGTKKVDLEKITSNDVTEEFVDLQSRLATKREARSRYMDILRNKTGEIADVIAAEEAIRKITEEIEAKQGRLRYLQNRVSLCTIDLRIYETVEYEKPPVVFHKTYSADLGDAFGSGLSMIKTLLLGLVAAWPFLILLSVVVYWKRGLIWRKKA